MKELCILFHYHRIDDLTLQHLQLLQQHNPNALIVPVTNNVSEYLPDSVDVQQFHSKWPTQNKWRSIDTTFYLWFLNRQVSAQRYLILEYDCRCTMPIREAYAAVWDAEVSCRSFYTPETKPDWAWFKPEELAKLDPADRPYAAGVVPYACSFFSHTAVERLMECVTPNDVFCELRLGTAIRRAGLEVVPFPATLKQGIFATPTQVDLNQPGIFHPVKAKEVHERNMKLKLGASSPHNGLLSQFKRSIKQAFTKN